jgi:PST family polysaccharide transporter
LAEHKTSYRQILRATSYIGVASGLNIVLQIVRVKVLAVMLGPVGMGLFGIYQSILSTASSLGGLGIGFSAVRQIAEARGRNDQTRVAEVVYVFRVLTIVLGGAAAALVFYSREAIALWTFGDSVHAAMVGWLAIGVFVGIASQSLGGLLQAYRRIAEQARLQVWSGVLSTVLALAAIAKFGQDGIVFFVVAMPFVSALIAWRYSRRIGVATRQVVWRSFTAEARHMIGLGFMVMAANALQGWALLALRSRITQYLGIDSAGLFQAAWTLSFVYMSFVLDSMGKDYYPHLTEQVADRQRSVQLMREQINVAVVLVGPLIVASITFAPILTDLLYAASFRDAVPMVQWMGLGNLFKVLSWPLGFIVVAKARSRLFFFLEIFWLAIFMGVAWTLLDVEGLPAVGIAFVTAYVLYLIVLMGVSYKLTDFSFDQSNLRLMLCYAILVTAAFSAARTDTLTGYVVGSFVFATASLISYWKVKRILGEDPLRMVIRKFFTRRKSG